MIISVHIGKTGGSSFKKILSEIYGDKLFFDYNKGKKPKYWYFKIRTFYRRLIKKRFHIPAGTEIIHGHIQSTKYDFSCDSRKYIVWLREPVQRVMSHFYYWGRNPNPTSMTYLAIAKRGFTIENFIRNRMTRDVQSRYIDGKNITDFAFVGITEQYERSIRLFLKMFGIEKNILIDKINVNGDRNGATYNIPSDLRDEIVRLNQKDHKLYSEALLHFESLCRKWGV